jgi:hypothetical protein
MITGGLPDWDFAPSDGLSDPHSGYLPCYLFVPLNLDYSQTLQQVVAMHLNTKSTAQPVFSAA